MDFYQKHFDPTFILMNNTPIEDFEGFSSADMNYLVYDTYSTDSPFQFKKNIPNDILDQIPFLLQIEYLLKKINDLGELKLTAKGFLPTPLVKEIYDLAISRIMPSKRGLQNYTPRQVLSQLI